MQYFSNVYPPLIFVFSYRSTMEYIFLFSYRSTMEYFTEHGFINYYGMQESFLITLIFFQVFMSLFLNSIP